MVTNVKPKILQNCDSLVRVGRVIWRHSCRLQDKWSGRQFPPVDDRRPLRRTATVQSLGGCGYVFPGECRDSCAWHRWSSFLTSDVSVWNVIIIHIHHIHQHYHVSMQKQSRLEPKANVLRNHKFSLQSFPCRPPSLLRSPGLTRWCRNGSPRTSPRRPNRRSRDGLTSSPATPPSPRLRLGRARRWPLSSPALTGLSARRWLANCATAPKFSMCPRSRRWATTSRKISKSRLGKFCRWPASAGCSCRRFARPCVRATR